MYRFIVFILSLMLFAGCDQTPTGRDQLALMPVSYTHLTLPTNREV